MTPTEGVPVAWAVVDRHGVLLPNSNEAAEVACFRTKDEADEELAYANQGEGAPPWEDSKPFAVVALAPTHPAAASAEREGAWKAMVEALTFYADLDENGNVQRFSDSNYTGDPDDVTFDRGAKARAAIAAARATKGV